MSGLSLGTLLSMVVLATKLAKGLAESNYSLKRKKAIIEAKRH